MGKVFITDEVDDGFTAKITETGAMHVVNHNSYIHITAAASADATLVSTSPCWLQSVTINSYPLTASTLVLIDASAAGTCASSYCVTALTQTGRIAKIGVPVVNGSTVSGNNSEFPRTLLYDLYCTSGLAVITSAGDIDATIVYKT